MENYYELIMSAKEDSFITIFNNLWSKELNSHKTPYKQALQLISGNRLRPILMAWGYYIGADMPSNVYIAQKAVCIELIHKASILLDDWIDGDTLRHGKKTFHIEYSSEEAILYSIYLINRSIQLINNFDKRQTDIFLQTITNMILGGIQEISLLKEINSYNVKDIKDIIDLETITIIKNSLLIGYRLSENENDYFLVEEIGQHLGYCFQVLNDLEPFMESQKNVSYKGTENYDVNKHRKNIVVAYLYGACSEKDRLILNKDYSIAIILMLVNKYNIISFVLDEVLEYMLLIDIAITKISNEALVNEFKHFISDMFKLCYQKLDLVFYSEIFNYR